MINNAAIATAVMLAMNTLIVMLLILFHGPNDSGGRWFHT